MNVRRERESSIRVNSIVSSKKDDLCKLVRCVFNGNLDGEIKFK